MHFLMCPIGSVGDVHPFLAIGRGLRERGHRVTIVTHTTFESLVRRYEFNFADLQDQQAYSEMFDGTDVEHPTKAIKRGARYLVNAVMRPLYARIAELHVAGETVVVAHNSGFGARIAHDKLGVPLVTAHFAPASIPSVEHPPRFSWWTLPDWAPAWTQRLYFWIGDKFLADPLMAPEINRFRAELGLAPVKRIMHIWNQSPQLILALFPSWFCEPRPTEWPPYLVATEFPLFDERPDEQLAPEIREFLNAGDPPIVFTPGTSLRHALSFFEAAADTCVLLKRRGMLLTRHDENVPKNLPPFVRHFKYVPFQLLLPHVAVMVSHAGIGTLAQTLRAGVPQLLVPRDYDQPDNAHRVVKLGVGRMLWPKHFNGKNGARAIRELLDDPEVPKRCRELASRFPADPISPSCDVLERFVRNPI